MLRVILKAPLKIWVGTMDRVKCTGNEASYQRGCRCEDCTRAHREYSRKVAKDRRLAASQDAQCKRRTTKRDLGFVESDAFTLQQIRKAREVK